MSLNYVQNSILAVITTWLSAILVILTHMQWLLFSRLTFVNVSPLCGKIALTRGKTV